MKMSDSRLAGFTASRFARCRSAQPGAAAKRRGATAEEEPGSAFAKLGLSYFPVVSEGSLPGSSALRPVVWAAMLMACLISAAATAGDERLPRLGAAGPGEFALDGADPPVPAHIAVETISTASDNTIWVDGANYFSVHAGAMDLTVTTVLRLTGEQFYLRVDLNGMAFRDLPAETNGLMLVYGGIAATYAVFRLYDVLPGDTIALTVTDRLAVADTESGDLTASMFVYSDLDEAIRGADPIAPERLGGRATVIRKVFGIDAGVSPDTAVIAGVGTRFLRFVGQTAGTGAAPEYSQAILGQAAVGVRALRPVDVLNAADGEPVTNDDLFAPGGVSITVEGNLSVGAFSLVREADDGSVACPDAVGTFDQPGEGNLIPGDGDDASLATLDGLASGTYHLCVEVDTAGAGSNQQPIPEAEYTARVAVKGPNASDFRQVASGIIGQILRNAAQVHLPYLTASLRYNQRLTIINHGDAAVTYQLDGFATVADQTAEPTDGATGDIPAQSMVVLRVADLVRFTGDGLPETAATLSVDTIADVVQVATTQVNREDGSTDTVVYKTTVGLPPQPLPD